MDVSFCCSAINLILIYDFLHGSAVQMTTLHMYIYAKSSCIGFR
jgi:hypothetical protein